MQPEAIARTAEAVAEFAKTARERNSSSVRVVATSAARDAINPNDLISAIERASGLKTEIISGAREAEWAFQGVATDLELTKTPLLLLDVGGGSTNLFWVAAWKNILRTVFRSARCGCMEKFPHSDPPTSGEFTACRDWLKNFLHHEVRPQLEPALKNETGEIQVVGTGGTTSILARIEKRLDRHDREKIESTILSFEQVVAHRKNLWKLPLAGRKEIPGLPKLRADVILTGVLIYETVMEEFGFKELRVSTRGLRFAAVMD